MPNLSGVWTPGMRIRQSHSFCPGRRTTIDGIAAKIMLKMDLPGVLALHYAASGNTFFWDEYEWRLRRRMRLSKRTGPVKQLQGGETVVFDGSTLTVRKTPNAHYYHPIWPDTMETATDRLEELLPVAAEAMLNHDGRKPILMLLSGGVDSISTLWALREAGADVHAVTVGRDDKDFDPQWARKIAEHMGVPWTLLTLPSDAAGLDTLLRYTIGTIEQTSFSNVLMGLCCTIIQRHMIEVGRKVAWLGYEADALMGNKMLLVGQHRALPPEEQTDTAWGHARQDGCWSVSPYTMQLSKNFRLGGETDWRTPFLHPSVASMLLSCPKEVIPPTQEKTLLHRLMERHLPPELCAWRVKQKIGFYTGSGAGKIRLENPILQDPNMQRHYREQKARLT